MEHELSCRIMECHGLARTCPVWSREPSGPFRRGRNEDTQRVADTSEPFEMLAEADQQVGIKRLNCFPPTINRYRHEAVLYLNEALKICLKSMRV